MNKSTTGQTDRARPSARLQAQKSLLQSTPVLFRLPVVEIGALPPVGDLPSEYLQQFHTTTADVGTTDAQHIPAPVAAAVEPAEESYRSWWEHWSSGVIVIVLLIAAYAAAIAVLRSRQASTANTLASTESESDALAGIQVPEIVEVPEIVTNEPRRSTSTTEQESLVSEPNGNEELANSLIDAVPPAVQQPAPASGLELSSIGELETSRHHNAFTLENSAKLPAAEPQTAAPEIGGTAAPSLATAHLLQPTEMPAQTLPLLPAEPAAESSSITMPVSAQLGQSPSLYDGATFGSTLPPLSATTPESNLANALAPQTQPVGNQPLSPLPPATTTTDMPNIVAGVTGAAPQTTTVSGQQVTAPFSGANSGPVLTSTPDANGDVEAIIKAYLELKRSGQSMAPAQTTAAPQTAPTTPTNNFNRYAPAQ